MEVLFSSYISATESTFTVRVPNNFGDRILCFDQVELRSDVNQIEALQKGFNKIEELHQIFKYDLSLAVKFSPRLLTGFFETDNKKTVHELISEANDYFEKNCKQAGFKRLPVLFDWCDLRFSTYNGSWDEFVQTKMSVEYYGVPFNSFQHFNNLPKSAQDFNLANNYLFPHIMSTENMDNLRVRILIAPNINVYFSNKVQLTRMGFRSDQISNRMQNLLPNDWRIVTALDPSKFQIEEPGKFKIRVRIFKSRFLSNYVTGILTTNQIQNNDCCFRVLTDVITQLSEETNYEVSLSYDSDKQVFEFCFPSNTAKTNVSVNLELELAHRLGFGRVSLINAKNNLGVKVHETLKIDQVKKEPLCNENQIRVGNTTFIFTNVGPLAIRMINCCPCLPLQITSLPTILMPSPGELQLEFELSNFAEDNVLVPFHSKVDSIIYGVLKNIERHSL